MKMGIPGSNLHIGWLEILTNLDSCIDLIWTNNEQTDP